MMFVDTVQVEIYPGTSKPWVLSRDVGLVCTKHKVDLRIGMGFDWNAANVPWVFTRLMPRSSPEFLIASLFHDYLYHHPIKGFDRERADELFKEVLIHCGVSKWKASLAFIGVRLGGWHSYDANGGAVV